MQDALAFRRALWPRTSASLCVHFSGSSVFKQAAQTKLICMLAKSGRPSESERLNILL